MTFTATLALYICTTAAYYITTPVPACMAEQEAAALATPEPTSYALHLATRTNWRGDTVGIDYVIVEEISNE